MTLADLEAVCAIEQRVQPYPWSMGNFRDALASGYFACVWQENGRVSAFSLLMMVLDEAEILNIAVDADCQRRGLGKAMLQHLFEYAQQAQLQRMFLEVRASNQPAIALYQQQGFVEVGRRCNYYVGSMGREDAVLMARDIS